ncbi:MAG: hypothetical protein WD100_04885 [Tistlia sp.]|uniref:hypothetical protein n=1 Tax=Tistlia sp. TaxID=3057121 RepID=UPI0034A1BBE6
MPLELSIAEAVARSGEIWAQACLAWQAELGRFAAARRQADAEIQASLAQCRDAAEVMRLQRDWFAAAVRDYALEADQLMRIASRAAGEGMTCWPPVTGQEVVESAQLID